MTKRIAICLCAACLAAGATKIVGTDAPPRKDGERRSMRVGHPSRLNTYERREIARSHRIVASRHIGEIAWPQLKRVTPRPRPPVASKPTLRMGDQGPSQPVPSNGVWERLAFCESGMRNLPYNGQYGGYFQFTADSWRRAGGTGLPGPDHSYEAQKAIAKSWLARTSPAQWPVCSRKAGLTMADAA